MIDVDEGAGTCRVRLRNNVVIAARGTAVPAGQMAFISDGMVTGPAPQLPSSISRFEASGEGPDGYALVASRILRQRKK